MGIFSRFEDRMEDTVEGAASRMSKAPISPVQIAKKAEKQMRRETMVGAGKEYAPTLYTVLVNPDDDDRLFGYYPTLAGETETYLSAKAMQDGLVMDGSPLVRFIVDDGLRHGKFEVIAEVVAAPIIAQLREEEMQRYGLAAAPAPQRGRGGYGQDAYAQDPYGQDSYGYDAYGQESYDQGSYGQDGYSQDPYGQDGYNQGAYDEGYYDQQDSRQGNAGLSYASENKADRPVDYGDYAFNGEDFGGYREAAPSDQVGYGYNEGYDAPLSGPGAGGRAMGAGAARGGRPPLQTPNTVSFAGGAGGLREAIPDRNAVRARLIDHTYQRPYDLAGTRVTLGRESGNDIRVQDINASRRHAELTLNQQGLWVITDLRSMNGTLVNGVAVASQPLYPGDIITIGKTDFEFALV